jgi:hypothetical protein
MPELTNVDYVAALEELVAIQDAYIAFLNEANGTMAFSHGWRCPQADIDKGVAFRGKMAALRAKTAPAGRGES